jgi:hypothetical protein
MGLTTEAGSSCGQRSPVICVRVYKRINTPGTPEESTWMVQSCCKRPNNPRLNCQPEMSHSDVIRWRSYRLITDWSGIEQLSDHQLLKEYKNWTVFALSFTSRPSNCRVTKEAPNLRPKVRQFAAWYLIGSWTDGRQKPWECHALLISVGTQ